MIDLIKAHFTAIFWTAVVLVSVGLLLIARLFMLFRSDAIREGKDDPTKIAAALTLSTLKGVARLRRASDTDNTSPRIARSSAELDMTITPGTLRADDVKPPKAAP